MVIMNKIVGSRVLDSLMNLSLNFRGDQTLVFVKEAENPKIEVINCSNI